MFGRMIDEIANQERAGFHPRNHATFGISSIARRLAAGFERERFDGDEKFPGFIVTTDRKRMEGAVGERVAVGRHLRRLGFPAAKVRE